MAKSKRKRRGKGATVEELMAAQAPSKSRAGEIGQGDIPPHLNVFATMGAAWNELAAQFIDNLPRKQQQDAKFIFFHGVQAAANLMIYAAGQSQFEAAADQIIADCVAYEKEAEAVLRERAAFEEAPLPSTRRGASAPN